MSSTNTAKPQAIRTHAHFFSPMEDARDAGRYRMMRAAFIAEKPDITAEDFDAQIDTLYPLVEDQDA